jgi:phage shock protein C
METRKLTRSQTERYVGGVAGGLAAYFNVDPVLVRLAFLVLAFANGVGLIIYVAMWLLVPAEGVPASDMGHQVKENAREVQATSERLARQSWTVVRNTADQFASEVRQMFQNPRQ